MPRSSPPVAVVAEQMSERPSRPLRWVVPFLERTQMMYRTYKYLDGSTALLSVLFPPVIPQVPWSPYIATCSIATRPRPSPTAARRPSSNTSLSTQSSKTAYGPQRVQVDVILPCVARAIPRPVPAIFQSSSIASVSIQSRKLCPGKRAGILQAGNYS